MQDLAYLEIDGLQIPVLRQSTCDGCRLKLCMGRTQGSPLPDESVYLEEHPEKLQDLLNGHVIRL